MRKIVKLSNCDICNRYSKLYSYGDSVLENPILVCDTCLNKLRKTGSVSEETISKVRAVTPLVPLPTDNQFNDENPGW